MNKGMFIHDKCYYNTYDKRCLKCILIVYYINMGYIMQQTI